MPFTVGPDAIVSSPAVNGKCINWLLIIVCLWLDIRFDVKKKTIYTNRVSKEAKICHWTDVIAILLCPQFKSLKATFCYLSLVEQSTFLVHRESLLYRLVVTAFPICYIVLAWFFICFLVFCRFRVFFSLIFLCGGSTNVICYLQLGPDDLTSFIGWCSMTRKFHFPTEIHHTSLSFSKNVHSVSFIHPFFHIIAPLLLGLSLIRFHPLNHRSPLAKGLQQRIESVRVADNLEHNQLTEVYSFVLNWIH